MNMTILLSATLNADVFLVHQLEENVLKLIAVILFLCHVINIVVLWISLLSQNYNNY